MVDVNLLGSGGNMPMPNRYLSATLINYEGRKILIDCGEGTQVSMKILGTGFKTIDLICITHCHGDHIIGLTGLLSTIGNSGREEPLTIVGPEGIKEVVDGLRVIVRYLPYEVNIIENPKFLNLCINDKGIILSDNNKSDIVLKTIECDHSTPCIGYSFYIKRKRKFSVDKAIENNVPKIFWNKLQKGEVVVDNQMKYEPDMVLGENRKGIKISLITDSRPKEDMIPFIKNSDLFICEGMFGSDMDLEKAVNKKHMIFEEAVTLAKEGQVKRLLLTHFSPSMSEPEAFKENASKVFKDTIIGEDRMTISLNFE